MNIENIATDDKRGGWLTQLGTCWICGAYLASGEHTQGRTGYIFQNEISHCWEGEWYETLGNAPF